MSQQSEEFEKLKKVVENKKNEFWELQKLVKINRKELEADIIQLQSICNHDFVRECINSGCYTEYASICKFCSKMC